MKKLFTFAMALMAAMAINATDYYFAGAANGWSNNNEAYKFVDVEGVLTLEVADLYGEFKVTENGAWHPQHGAAVAGEGVALNGSYNLVKCDDSEGEKDAPANARILFPQEGDWRYKDAKLTLDASNPDALVISLVAGTLYDHSVVEVPYYLIGAFNGWSLESAVEFVDVNGVLTANVADLSGTFKVIKERKWGTEYCSNGEGVVLGEDYVMPLGGQNIALANPFGGYRDAVLTLTISGDEHILKLVSGTFYIAQNDWFVPGSWQGATWACNDAAKMTPVDGQANTYELLLAEFAGEFKVVYGDWAVEFGAAKDSGEQWNVNTPIELSFPCDNMKPEDPEAVYQDVTITLVVDYDNVAATLTIATEGTAVQTIQLNAKSIKRIENGQVIIENNGVRFNAAGIAQ
ncbi:MAG: hypothetical protein IJS92_03240 [Paludibacteraceae bacterium]|nr:hypothetical protein [Paludibacteraceae bacterium]